MTHKPPGQLKSEKALLQYIATRAHELSAAIEISSPEPSDHVAQVRRSVDALLKCADLVTEIDSLAKGFPPKAELSSELRYGALSVGQLQTLGYLSETAVRGALIRPGSAPAQVGSRPTGNGYEVSIDGSAHQTLQLEATATSFGGHRWWFACAGVPTSSCGRRVLKLYRRQGQEFFACRDCHRASSDHGWRSAKDRPISNVKLRDATAVGAYPRSA